MRIAFLLAGLLVACVAVTAQSCPARDSQGPFEAPSPSTLHGTLLVHNDLRDWIGLKLDRPACGESEIELVFQNGDGFRGAETYNGCALTAIGKLFDSPTGYYSANIAISDPDLKPDPSCHPSALTPDPSESPMPPAVTRYRASIVVDYRGRGRVTVEVRDSQNNQPLKPWQPFVKYLLTGGRDGIWFSCGDGFTVQKASASPKSPHGIFSDDPNQWGMSLEDLTGMNTIHFICKKTPKPVSLRTPPKQ